MDPADDEDLKLLRASAGLLVDLRTQLPKLLWKTSANAKRATVHRFAREGDVLRLISKIVPFQEDPQLLDAHLKHILPLLVTAYLDTLQLGPTGAARHGSVTIRSAICKILYNFCKVRGEKVIVGFLNNEPRYLEPLLSVFENGTQLSDDGASAEKVTYLSWEERYILLLWLSHQMLAPFDLASISSFAPEDGPIQAWKLRLPSDLPGIPLRVIPIAFQFLGSATRERSAAATLLVRLCLRPDMRKVGLLDSIVEWAVRHFRELSDQHADIHKSLGVLFFLSRLVNAANTQEIGTYLFSIFNLCQTLTTSDSLAPVRSSAIARRLVIKIFRCIVLLCLAADAPSMDVDTVTEDVIGYFLQSVADGDSPVRYAASKALSIITMQLDAPFAADVIEAILGRLNEDVLWEESSRNLNAVNALQWHGLTLTLGHLLYRRATSVAQLPDLLNALLLALNFEQRSATGSLIGTNVRDAANFGLWALSRRYTVPELKGVDATAIRAFRAPCRGNLVTQLLAVELVESACLDPAGNIRRGSSAALQELIGRHPDTVIEGIPLVQTVDFHAVGLRGRAITEVAITASELNPIYWDALFHAMLGWRGIGAVDMQSREHAATAIGLLASAQPLEDTLSLVQTIQEHLVSLKTRQIEERHGLMLSLASLLMSVEKRVQNVLESGASAERPRIRSLLEKLTALWSVWNDTLRLEDRDLTSGALRPELTALATCELLTALSLVTMRLETMYSSLQPPNLSFPLRLLWLCLQRTDQSVISRVASTVNTVTGLLTTSKSMALVRELLTSLRRDPIAKSQRTGHAIALGAMFPIVQDNTPLQLEIIEALTQRCTFAVSIEARVLALRSLTFILPHLLLETAAVEKMISRIGEAIGTALNDYTINERGDVGSLVRLQALDVLESAWKLGFFQNGDISKSLYSSVIRLALEKLDKVRVASSRCLQASNGVHLLNGFGNTDEVHAVSSYAYFRFALKAMISGLANPTAAIEGYISSAGMGSESTAQAARRALCDVLDQLPVIAPDDEQYQYTLVDLANQLVSILHSNLNNDRVLFPFLETLAFLLDMRALRRLAEVSFNFRELFNLIRKAHFKSSNLHKLHLALDVYRGLADIEAIRRDVLEKMLAMLLHPFPKVRVGAAEALFVTTGSKQLKKHDWTMSTKALKDVAEVIRNEILSKN